MNLKIEETVPQGGDADLRKELQAEYAILQAQYEDFDKRVLSLKGLATPLLGAGIVAGVSNDSQLLVLATAIVAATLWVLEVIWKVFQYCHVPRMEIIEKWFRGEINGVIAPFQIYESWSFTWRRKWKNDRARMLRIAATPFASLPYLPIIVAALGVLILIR